MSNFNFRSLSDNQLREMWAQPIPRQTKGLNKGVITAEGAKKRDAIIKEWCVNRGLHMFDLTN